VEGSPIGDGLCSFSWVTSHVFRKTAATELDRAGLSARQIADQLGHAKVSMTQDRYMGRVPVDEKQPMPSTAPTEPHKNGAGRKWW
jgi:integrase